MSLGAIQASGKWRIKPSGKLPIFLRFIINASLNPAYLKKYGITGLPNRTYLDHMMYWPAEEYNAYESDILAHLEKDETWFDRYVRSQLAMSRWLYKDGLKYK